MNESYATFSLAGVSLLALLVLIDALRRPVARSVSWTTAGYFLLALAWFASLGPTVGAMTGQRRVVVNITGLYAIRYSGLSQAVVVASGALVLAVSVITIALSVKMANTIGLAGVIALAVWVIAVAVNAVNGVQTSVLSYMSFLATGSALTAAAVIRPGKDAALGPAVYGISVGIVSALVAVVNPDSAYQECRADKCGPLGMLFPGALGNENAFGLAMALGLPFVILSFRGSTRWLLSSYILFMVWASGSRSALIAALVVVGIAMLCNPCISGDSVRGHFWPIPLSTAILAALCGIVLPFLTNERAAFSYRGLVWETAIRHFWEAPILGSGANGWQKLVAMGEVSTAQAYSAHSLWIDTLFTVGIAGFTLIIVLFAVVGATTPKWLLILPVLAILVAGINERPWSFTSANWLVWTLPALLLLRRERGGHAEPGCAISLNSFRVGGPGERKESDHGHCEHV